MVLGGEDVAARPCDFSAQLQEGLDENGSLDGHVQTARDPGTLQGLGVAVLGPQVHQTGHLILGDDQLLAAVVGQGDVG